MYPLALPTLHNGESLHDRHCLTLLMQCRSVRDTVHGRFVPPRRQLAGGSLVSLRDHVSQIPQPPALTGSGAPGLRQRMFSLSHPAAVCTRPRSNVLPACDRPDARPVHFSLYRL